MVKEGIARTVPKIVITPMENIDPTPVVNQPVFAPEGAHQQHFGNVFLAPAVAVNNVAQGQWGDRKKLGVYFGTVVGAGVIGAVTGTGGTEIAMQLGVSVVVSTGIGLGVALLGTLCTVGSAVATAYYCANR